MGVEYAGKIIGIAVALIIFAFPIAFCISQTAEAGLGNEITVSQRLVTDDNIIIDSDVVQVSIVKTGSPGFEDSSEDSTDDGSGGNSDDESGGGSDNGSGGGSGGDQPGGSGNGSGGGPENNSGGSSGEGTDEAEGIMAGEILGNFARLVVINEVHPCPDRAVGFKNENVELYNTGRNPLNVSRWHLENITRHVIATIRNKEIPPHGFLAVEVTGLPGDAQGITLFDSANNKIDSVNYIGARSHNGSCYARIPDGEDIWEWTACTLGSSNRQRSG